MYWNKMLLHKTVKISSITKKNAFKIFKKKIMDFRLIFRAKIFRSIPPATSNPKKKR